MGRSTEPRNKQARREGMDLGLKTVGSNAHTSLLRRIKIRPGQHGQKRQRKLSEYAQQLREKQKVKQIYGILESQFRAYYTEAARIEGVTGQLLLRQLEQRLDNVIYRMGIASTRAAARQLVGHGHVLVNERRVDIPSYQVVIGDVIRLHDGSVKIPIVQALIATGNHQAPAWLTIKGVAAKVIKYPMREDITDPIEEQLIVEYYSR